MGTFSANPSRPGSERGASGHETTPNGQLVCDAGQGGASQFLADTTQFIENRPRLDDGRPVFDLTLAFTHPGFGRNRGHALLGEDADVKLAATLHRLAADDPARLDRLGADLARFQSLESKLTESDIVA